MIADLAPVKRALLSVTDKTGVVEFATRLVAHGIELLSTGGTAQALRDAGLSVVDVADYTGFPEMMDGRVKTLHPKVHGGLLALRDHASHVDAMTTHGIAGIDLLCVNLYAFEQTVASGADADAIIENIDIGGPAMIRSASKNHGFVTVVTDVNDYATVVAELEVLNGCTSLALRRKLAAKAFALTGAYDAAIASWFSNAVLGESLPDTLVIAGRKVQALRYGENPHQFAAVYKSRATATGLVGARQVQGKELSYNNLNDTDAALELIAEFDAATPAVAIIKHANPCGVATGATLEEAYRRALACDPTSAFGGIVVANQPLDAAAAHAITDIFTEVVAAPDAEPAAIEVFAAKKNLRLLLTGARRDPATPGPTIRSISGGYLVQSRDNGTLMSEQLKVVTTRAPSPAEIADLLFAWRVAKHVKSNAIVYARAGQTLGIGAGQMSRIDSTRIAGWKAAEAGLDTHGAVVASDAFFPFADGLLAAAAAGVTAVIQPGGSIRDAEVIAAANDKGLAMVFTNQRHFRH